MAGRIVLLLQGVLLLPLLGCGDKVESTKVVDPIFEHVDRRGPELRVRLRHGVSFGEAVDLAVFGELATEQPLWLFTERADSSPARDSLSRTTWRFSRADGHLEIRKITVESEGPAVEKWELRFFPKESQSLLDLQPSLARLGNIFVDDLTLVSILDAQAQGNLTLDVRRGRVLSEYLAFPGRQHIREPAEAKSGAAL